MIAAPIIAACLAIGQAPNLAANAGFEDLAPDGRPAGWGAGPYAVDEDAAHSGDRALHYENTDPESYVLCGQPIALEAGRAYEFSAWIRTEAVEGPEGGATICIEYNDAEGNYLGGRYPMGLKGTNEWALVSDRTTRIPEGAESFRIICYLRRGAVGKAWWDDLEIRAYHEPPLSTMLVKPNYRGLVHRGVPAVELAAELTLRDYAESAGDVTLQVQAVGADGEVAAEASVEPEAERVVVSLPTDDLEPGAYTLRTRLLRRADGTEMGSDEWRMRVTDEPDLSGRISFIDEHNRLIVNGEPFFPLGTYWGSITEEDLRPYAESAFNCLMPYGAPSMEAMDLAGELGLKVIYSVKDIYHGSRYSPEGIDSEEDERAHVEGKVAAYGNHPALLAWYLNDELPVAYMDRLETHQAWLEELDPNHPTWVVLYQVGELAEYRKTFDAIGTDPYPVPQSPIRRAGDWTRQTREAVHESRSVWMVPQIFNWACYRGTDEEREAMRAPTPAEMRSMAWQCIAEGANGLVFYSFFDLKRDPGNPFEERWPLVAALAEEIAELSPVILSVEPTPLVEAEEAEWLHWTLRQVGDVTYLIAVSDSGDGAQAQFGVPEGTTLEGGDGVSLRGERLVLEFEPMDVHVVRLRTD